MTNPQPNRWQLRTVLAAITTASAFLPAACRRADSRQQTNEVVLYTSVDEQFARQVIQEYEKLTGVRVLPVFDSEAGKTTGLVNRIIREAETGRPRGDVFWSSELFNTILLGRRGVLEPYDSPSAADIPDRFRDPHHRWTATAVRARVLAFDPKQLDPSEGPRKWEDLAEPQFASRTTIANPLFGTTRGHVAAMFAMWGPQRARAFLTALREAGAHVSDSNSAAVRAVSAGRAQLAMTDTDDVWVARRVGASIDLTYPDMGEGGTLLVPCSVAVIKGGPNPEQAKRLVDFLVSAAVEAMLARSDSRNIPVRESLRRDLDLDWPPESKVDFHAVADAMDEAVAAVREILIR